LATLTISEPGLVVNLKGKFNHFAIIIAQPYLTSISYKDYKMNINSVDKCPPSKTNSPGPFPVTETFRPAPDNIISTITDTGAVGT